MAFYLIIYLSWVYQEINVHFLHADASVQIIRGNGGTVQYVLRKKVQKLSMNSNSMRLLVGNLPIILFWIWKVVKWGYLDKE